MNVIVICLDTFRADIVGEGQKLSSVHTPNLDAFATQAVTFSHAFGEGQPTLQMRRSAFTGMRSFPWRWNFDRRGHWHHAPGWHKIPPEQDTLAEILLDRGYFTGLVADTYHMFKPTMNYTRGFVTYEFVRGQETDNWRGGTLEMIEDELRRCLPDPSEAAKHPHLLTYLFNMRGREREEDYLCARVFRTAAQWLDDNAANAPFFLWVDSFDPHEPWDPPRPYATRYKPDYEGTDPIYPFLIPDPTPDQKDWIKALYFGEVTFVDKWVGHLLDKIDRLKLWDDTLVIVTSDHGTQMFDHGVVGKSASHMHPYNTRLNWLLRHPGGPSGATVDGLVQAHDIPATILARLGVPHPTEGLDAWPLVTGEAQAIRDHVVTGWATFCNGRATARASARDAGWNYVVGIGYDDPQPELYDLHADPEEDTNVVAHHPDIVALQRRRIEQVIGQKLPGLMNECCDAGPSPSSIYWTRRRQREGT